MPDAFLKVAVLFKKLLRTGSPSQMSLGFLFSGGLGFLVYRERETTVLPDASPGTKQLQEGTGLGGGASPRTQRVQGTPPAHYLPRAGISSPKIPLQTSRFLCKASLLHLLLGWSHGWWQDPPHSPISKGISFKPTASTHTTGSKKLLGQFSLKNRPILQSDCLCRT